MTDQDKRKKVILIGMGCVGLEQARHLLNTSNIDVSVISPEEAEKLTGNSISHIDINPPEPFVIQSLHVPSLPKTRAERRKEKRKNK